MLHQREPSSITLCPPVSDLEDFFSELANDPFLFPTDSMLPVTGDDSLDKVLGAELFVDVLTPPYSPVEDVFREIAEATLIDQIFEEHDYSKPWNDGPSADSLQTSPASSSSSSSSGAEDVLLSDLPPVTVVKTELVVPAAPPSVCSDVTQDTSSESDVDVVTVTSDPEFYDDYYHEPARVKKPKRKCVRKESSALSSAAFAAAVSKKPPGRRRGRKPAYIHSDLSSPYESEQDKKETHNQLERKRRNDLSRAYQDVRTLIPALQDNPRASKVKILESAASLVHSFSQQNLEETLRRERKEMDRILKEIHRIQALQ